MALAMHYKYFLPHYQILASFYSGHKKLLVFVAADICLCSQLLGA